MAMFTNEEWAKMLAEKWHQMDAPDCRPAFVYHDRVDPAEDCYRVSAEIATRIGDGDLRAGYARLDQAVHDLLGIRAYHSPSFSPEEWRKLNAGETTGGFTRWFTRQPSDPYVEADARKAWARMAARMVQEGKEGRGLRIGGLGKSGPVGDGAALTSAAHPEADTPCDVEVSDDALETVEIEADAPPRNPFDPSTWCV